MALALAKVAELALMFAEVAYTIMVSLLNVGLFLIKLRTLFCNALEITELFGFKPPSDPLTFRTVGTSVGEGVGVGAGVTVSVGAGGMYGAGAATEAIATHRANRTVSVESDTLVVDTA